MTDEASPDVDYGDGPALEMLEAGMTTELAEREAPGRGAGRRVLAANAVEEADAKAEAALPEPEVLSERLSPELLAALDESLRLRFARVKKIPLKHLNAQVSPSADEAAEWAG